MADVRRFAEPVRGVRHTRRDFSDTARADRINEDTRTAGAPSAAPEGWAAAGVEGLVTGLMITNGAFAVRPVCGEWGK